MTFVSFRSSYGIVLTGRQVYSIRLLLQLTLRWQCMYRNFFVPSPVWVGECLSIGTLNHAINLDLADRCPSVIYVPLFRSFPC